MAERYSFFNDVNGDRTYQAGDFAEYFSMLVTNGVFPGTLTVVTPTADMKITIFSGAAYIKGYLFILDADKFITIDPSDPNLNRKDLVVVRLDTSRRLIELVVKKGTPASTAIAPTVTRTGAIYELALAEVSVKKGVTVITQADVTDTRLDATRCGEVNSLIQADTTQIFLDYQDWFNTTTNEKDNEWQTWFQSMKDQVQNDDHTAMNDRIDQNAADIYTLSQNKADINSIGWGGKAVDISGQDLNDLSRPSGYYAGNNLVNAPTTAYFHIQHMKWTDTRFYQIIRRQSPYSYGEIYVRVYDATIGANGSTGWQEWRTNKPFLQKIKATNGTATPLTANVYSKLDFGTQSVKNWANNEYIIPVTGQYKFTLTVGWQGLGATANTVTHRAYKNQTAQTASDLSSNGEIILSFGTMNATTSTQSVYAGDFVKGDKIFFSSHVQNGGSVWGTPTQLIVECIQPETTTIL